MKLILAVICVSICVIGILNFRGFENRKYIFVVTFRAYMDKPVHTIDTKTD